ncbi:unnamed protein product [Haemonchus placei]|uniref:Uncharacterized protein n=1 Tax=Haemonchus placei TaxID=6290 RepID=A0A0N4WPC8_HAEPC|nr:unnamed protein product [Haemonchus placei]
MKFGEELAKASLDNKSFEKVKQIHRNWYYFALKALMGQLAKELLRNMDSQSGERLKLCLRRILTTKDLKLTAMCLTKTKRKWERFKNENNSRLQSKETVAFKQEPEKHRNFISKARILDFNKLNVSDSLSRKAGLKKKIYKATIPQKRSKRSPYRLVMPDIDSNSKKVGKSGTMPPLFAQTTKSPLHNVADLFVSLFGKVPVPDLSKKWSTTYKNLEKVADVLENNEKLPGARVYNARVYDIVVGNNVTKPAEVYVPSYLQDVFNVVNSFKGGENTRILSPRIAPLMPDKAKRTGVLSPSVFPFYRDDAEEQIMPIPKVLEETGLNEKDREKVLEMIMEVSGAREAADNALKIGETFERLRSSMSGKQNEDLVEKGYTFLEAAQLRKLHKDQDLHEPEIKAMVDEYGALNKKQREEALWEAIANIAGLNKRRRHKRQFRAFSALAPSVLSPYQFAPVYGMSVLGPVVLSPNTFSPLVLNPSVLGPWVLSPAVPLPFVISPYLLSPYVLSPLVLAPFVFSPYVLSPNVINPYVLAPVVLSPMVLCPDVISPMVLAGAVLSPSVASPSVLSKSYLMADVLSPTLSATSKDNVKSVKDLALSQEDFNKIRTIHNNWYLFSIKALLAQMAKEFLSTASYENAENLKSCLKRIQHTKDIKKTARCLIVAKEHQEEQSERQEPPAFVIEKEPQQIRRPWLAGVTRLSLLRLKNAAKRRREMMEQTGELRPKRSPHRLVVSSVLKSDSDFVEVKQQQTAPPLVEPANSPAHRLSKLFVSLFSKTPTSEVSTRWSTTYKKMLELKKKLDENEKLPGKDVYDRKIYDIVVDDDTSSEGGLDEVSNQAMSHFRFLFPTTFRNEKVIHHILAIHPTVLEARCGHCEVV